MTAPSRWFWPAVVAGAGGALVGVAVVAHDVDDANPVGLVAVLAGLLVLHDAVLGPVAHRVAGRLGRRRRPGALAAALAVSAVVVGIALPLVLGLGRRPTNSSTLPLAYGRNLLVVLAAVWGVAGVASLVAARRRAGRR
jgi:MFS family permease